MTNEPHPAELLAELIRFDTTNPPGNEAGCIAHIEKLMEGFGLRAQRFWRDPGRPSLLVRLPGRSEAPPLLLYGHVDVVTANPSRWTYPPFAGTIEDGWVWGRGALDMKGAIAMMATAVLRFAASGSEPPGDVLFLCLADEEAGGRYGARFLVEEHPDLFEGVRHAVSEFGGVPVTIAGRRFYAIQIAEKQPCWLEVTFRGPAGHGALRMRGGSMAKLGRALTSLDRTRLPVHITPPVRRMIQSVATDLPWPKRALLRLLLNPRLTDLVLSLLGEAGLALEPLFRNTANATTVRGGEKPNVIPGEIVLGLDTRILPGQTPEDAVDELRSILGPDADVRVLLHDSAPAGEDDDLLDRLGGILKELDPSAVSVPLLLPGSTDARFFSTLGIQTYGFTPMNLSADFDFFSTIHGADERIPVAALEFGTEAIYRLIGGYGEA
jgi:acetylornithine deacetylase/succinyl-diaminopimelate desuccinylase-like protein